MSSKLLVAVLSLTIGATPFVSTAQAGCIGGAIVGGVAGHMAHKHTLAGAAAGCVIGHTLAVRKKKKEAAERAARRAQAQQQQMQPAPSH
jgi:uncharacterized protein YcfJ